MTRALLAVALLTVTACDSASDLPIRLDAGTRTTYAYTFTSQVEGGPEEAFDAYDVVQEVRATNATVAGQQGLTHLVFTADPSSGLGEMHMWYRVSEQSLDEVAYGSQIGGPQTPLRTAALDPTLPVTVARALAARGLHADGARGSSDSTTVRDTPRRVVEYPLSEGRTWRHWMLSSTENDLHSTRTVLGARTVETPEGARRCSDIRTDLFNGPDRLNDLDWTECHDADGVVEARLTYRTMDETGAPMVVREYRVRTRVETPS